MRALRLHSDASRSLLLAALALALSGCFHAAPRATGDVDEGIAGYYGKAFEGHRTASGEPFRSEAMTCAHRTLPFGAWVEVTRLDDGRHVRVRVNDRGPFVSGRIIDLSVAAARKLGLLRAGLAQVRLRVLSVPRER